MEESRSEYPYRDMTDVFAVLAKKRVYIRRPTGAATTSGIRQISWRCLTTTGASVSHHPTEADAIIINTCTVVGPTEAGCSGGFQHFGKNHFLSQSDAACSAHDPRCLFTHDY